MKILRVVQYADIFPEQVGNLPRAETLLKGINRAHLCTLTSNMLSRLVSQPFSDDRLNPTAPELTRYSSQSQQRFENV